MELPGSPPGLGKGSARCCGHSPQSKRGQDTKEPWFYPAECCISTRKAQRSLNHCRGSCHIFQARSEGQRNVGLPRMLGAGRGDEHVAVPLVGRRYGHKAYKVDRAAPVIAPRGQTVAFEPTCPGPPQGRGGCWAAATQDTQRCESQCWLSSGWQYKRAMIQDLAVASTPVHEETETV